MISIFSSGVSPCPARKRRREELFFNPRNMKYGSSDNPKDLIRVERMSQHMYDIGQMLKTPITEKLFMSNSPTVKRPNIVAHSSACMNLITIRFILAR